MQKHGLTLHAIASQEHVTPGYVSRLLRLSSLAPDIITAIVSGKNPPQLTAKKLMRLALEYRSTGPPSGSCLVFTHDKRAPSRPPHVRQACLYGFLSGSTNLTKLES